MAVALTKLDTDEVLRYMGCPPEQAKEDLRLQVERGTQQVQRVAVPRWAYRVFAMAVEEEGVRLSCGLLLPGKDLKAHLSGCGQVVLFCATLGAQVDALIRRAESEDMLQALILDCAAAAAVEQVCDQIEGQLQRMFPEGHFPFRYSPGYGDLPLSLQGDLLALLDAPRRVGLTATSSHILLPRKSVTAFLGVADWPVEGRVRSCVNCPAYQTCQYRKSGGHCGIS